MASTPNSKSFKELLAEALPKDTPFTFYHFSTPPTKSPALYSAPPHTKPERTYCESHFLAVSIIPKPSNSAEIAEEFLVLAIEVLIYSTKHLTTVFVSKADSTGCISTLGLPRSQSGSPLKAVSGTFVSWLVRERQRPGKRLVVSLFARAQDQYLFPGSVENVDKHVLDDRGLIRWWCRVLDPVVRDYAPEQESKSLSARLVDSASKASVENGHTEVDAEVDIEKSADITTAKGYLIIPGFDTHDMLRYIPPPPSSNSKPRWTATHPLLRLAPHPAAPPRCLIPHFPDDPKSRFLDELDEELPDHTGGAQGGTPSRSNGHWKSVKTLDQFWDMMAFRQECCSGRCVGFIWVVVTPPHASIKEEEAGDGSKSRQQSQSQHPPAPSDSQVSLASIATSSPKRPRPASRRRISTRSGPIPLRLPRIKSSSSTLSTLSTASQNISSNSLTSLESHLPPVTTSYFHWPPASRGTLLFTAKHYARALDVLLQQNFTTRAAAARSSARWRDEVGVLAGVERWGWSVVGKKEWGSSGSERGAGSGGVNVLGVRRKRKVEGEANGAAPAAQAEQGRAGVQPNVLSAGLVRKKAKFEEGSVMAAQGAANGVNMLEAGLVRKKPKN